MKRDTRIRIIASSVVAITIGLFVVDPLSLPKADHIFADSRPLAGVPNAADVLSNLAFLLVGLLGLLQTWKNVSSRPSAFTSQAEALPWLLFFAATALTSLGSVAYHLQPTDDTLLWDRLPLGVAMASFITAAITERIGVREGLLTLPVLLVFTLLSILLWYHGQDPRYYFALQGVAILTVPLLCALLPGPYTGTNAWFFTAGLYVLAKLAELGDHAIYTLGGVVSGHTLKHLLAALAVWVLVRLLQRRMQIGA
jgi:UDP-N-acetylmuramyl pentapeptide phosphotransferase/UDP-N-acetylglucosamine-1-phosphate transferase